MKVTVDGKEYEIPDEMKTFLEGFIEGITGRMLPEEQTPTKQLSVQEVINNMPLDLSSAIKNMMMPYTSHLEVPAINHIGQITFTLGFCPDDLKFTALDTDMERMSIAPYYAGKPTPKFILEAFNPANLQLEYAPNELLDMTLPFQVASKQQVYKDLCKYKQNEIYQVSVKLHEYLLTEYNIDNNNNTTAMFVADILKHFAQIEFNKIYNKQITNN